MSQPKTEKEKKELVRDTFIGIGFVLFIVLVAVLFHRSWKKKYGPPPTTTTTTTTTTLPTLPETAYEFNVELTVRNLISQWIEDNPRASLARVVRAANEFLRDEGYPYQVLFDSGEVYEEHYVLKSRKGDLLGFKSWIYDPCGEPLVQASVPLVGYNEGVIEIAGERSFQLVGAPTIATILRKNKEILRLPVPKPLEEIVSIAPDKVILKFPISGEAIYAWWNRNDFSDYEYPHLVLALTKNGPKFLDIEEYYSGNSLVQKVSDNEFLDPLSGLSVRGVGECP